MTGLIAQAILLKKLYTLNDDKYDFQEGKWLLHYRVQYFKNILNRWSCLCDFKNMLVLIFVFTSRIGAR